MKLLSFRRPDGTPSWGIAKAEGVIDLGSRAPSLKHALWATTSLAEEGCDAIAPETVLIRGIGPGLSQFGVSGVLAAPQLSLYDAGGNVLSQTTAWGGSAALAAAFSQAGAFSLPASSTDAAIVVTLPPGNYTVQVAGAGGSVGVALVEVYELP